MSPNNDKADVAADARWLPVHWHSANDTIDFAWIERDAHSALSFLSEEYWRPLDPATVSLPRSTVPEPAPNHAHYIFHSAFCCSTLLTRALNVPGKAMGLNEPGVLIDLASAAQQRRLSHEALQSVTRLLARPFSQGETIAIKPGNEANVLAHAILGLAPDSRALFLYAPLPRFLASVARKGMWGRIWARRLFATLRVQTGVDFGLADAELWQLTDLQVAALSWLMHHAQGAAMLAAFPERVRSLDSETFLANRAETLDALGVHFGIALDGKEIAAGPAFKSHSKEIGRAVDPEAPLEPRVPIPTVDEEIAMVASWAESMATHVGIVLELPRQSALLASA